ncbi:hypothetical protein JZ751_019732 [Albula glossodonta]|uniref:Ig-like domain-containing protein n=1 Tax=Albula glossodonta TaxID=121402 RepID=A0A8T2MS66_9TELE|nr:hypothetical protein JZ751_019732 [Albula glossodonta]
MDIGLKIVAIVYLCFVGCRAEDTVTQMREDVIAFEGQTVTFDCTYSSSSTQKYLFWYIQYPNGFPKYILRRDTVGAGETVPEFKERFGSELNKTSSSVPLTIQKMQLSDSAVYYCALRPTVTEELNSPVNTILRESEWRTCSALVLALSNSVEDKITSAATSVYCVEGDSVKFSCNYTGSARSLQWYRQYPRSKPEFIILRVVSGVTTEGQFTINLDENKRHVDLKISSAEVSDSALYYCALEPTDAITSKSKEEHVSEGSSVTLSCNYTSANPSNLQWYRQYSGSSPEFLIRVFVSSETDDKDGFIVKHDKQSKSGFPLERKSN